MLQTIKRLAIGASMVVGASAIATAPAFAASITGAGVTGVNGTDYYLYDANATNTYRNDSASLSTILTGNASSPTGNVELFANSEKSPLSPAANATIIQRQSALKSFAAYTTSTTLSGQIGGKNISLSSLTAADWFGASGVAAINNGQAGSAGFSSIVNGLYNTSNLATQWFNKTLSTYGMTPTQTLFTGFLLNGGFQRFSDPNISYVNQNDSTGLISIGLAGHYDAATLLGLTPNPSRPLQASEIVKYSYNGTTDYLYSFTATNSGLVEQGDGISHKGNYEVTIAGIPPVKVPEPSSMLGLMAVGGLFAASKRKALKKA